MDDLEVVRVLDAGDELLEETAGAGFGHPAVLDYVVEELAAGVFQDYDDVGRGGYDFVAGGMLASKWMEDDFGRLTV